MQTHEFESQVDRLIQRFGIKYYPQERVRVLWDKINFKSISTFHQAVDLLIGENQTDPDNKKIFDAVYSVDRRNNSHLAKEDPPHQIQCKDCLDMGFMFIAADDGMPTWVYCHCPDGLQQFDSRNLEIPRWNQSCGCIKKDIPVSFFKPRDTGIESVMKKALEWNKELRDAERYWRSRLNERNL